MILLRIDFSAVLNIWQVKKVSLRNLLPIQPKIMFGNIMSRQTMILYSFCIFRLKKIYVFCKY